MSLLGVTLFLFPLYLCLLFCVLALELTAFLGLPQHTGTSFHHTTLRTDVQEGAPCLSFRVQRKHTFNFVQGILWHLLSNGYYVWVLLNQNWELDQGSTILWFDSDYTWLGVKLENPFPQTSLLSFLPSFFFPIFYPSFVLFFCFCSFVFSFLIQSPRYLRLALNSPDSQKWPGVWSLVLCLPNITTTGVCHLPSKS